MLLAERPFSSSEFQRLTFKITGKQALCLQVYFEPIGSASESVGTNERAASRRVLGSTGDNASKCRLDVWTEMSMDLDVLPGIAWQAIAFKVRARRARRPRDARDRTRGPLTCAPQPPTPRPRAATRRWTSSRPSSSAT